MKNKNKEIMTAKELAKYLGRLDFADGCG